MPRMARYWMLVPPAGIDTMSFWSAVPPMTALISRSSVGMTIDATRTFDWRSTRSAWARDSRCVVFSSLKMPPVTMPMITSTTSSSTSVKPR